MSASQKPNNPTELKVLTRDFSYFRDSFWALWFSLSLGIVAIVLVLIGIGGNIEDQTRQLVRAIDAAAKGSKP